MSEEPSRSMHLLAQLEAQVEQLTKLEEEVNHWLAVAERQRQRADRIERQMYRTTPHFTAERDGLKQELDTAHRLLGQLVDLLRLMLETNSIPIDRQSLQGIIDTVTTLSKNNRLLDNANLDTTAFHDPV